MRYRRLTRLLEGLREVDWKLWGGAVGGFEEHALRIERVRCLVRRIR